MEHRCDVAVIGAGAAGVAAARAAHAKGRTVVIVDGGLGASSMTAGWIEPARSSEPSKRLAWLAELGLRAPGKYRFVTLAGVVVEAVSGLTSLLDVDSLPKGTLGVLDIQADPAWGPTLVASSLDRELGRSVRVVTPREGFVSARGTLALACALETKEGRDALCAALRDAVKGFAGVLFPPVLGITETNVAQELSQALGCVVGEAGGGPGDPTAFRFARTLERAIPSECTRVRGRGRIEWNDADPSVVTDTGERVHARAIVLATGGFAGGGIAYDTLVHEPCVDAPVWMEHDGVFEDMGTTRVDPQRLFSPDDVGRTDASCVGVRVDASGRLLGPDGHTPLRATLFAAGDVIVATDGQSTGIADALANGRTAGEHAAAAAST